MHASSCRIFNHYNGDFINYKSFSMKHDYNVGIWVIPGETVFRKYRKYLPAQTLITRSGISDFFSTNYLNDKPEKADTK